MKKLKPPENIRRFHEGMVEVDFGKIDEGMPEAYAYTLQMKPGYGCARDENGDRFIVREDGTVVDGAPKLLPASVWFSNRENAKAWIEKTGLGDYVKLTRTLMILHEEDI